MFMHPTVLLDIAKEQRADLIKEIQKRQLIAAVSPPSRWERMARWLKTSIPRLLFKPRYLAKAMFNRQNI